ncbi:MAG: hypothetical protein KKI08_16815 [Armatimonadetes bacterium]|nr:hypothetical protein [Armatimonadota bacterium]
MAERGLTGARVGANPLDIRHNLAYDAARSAAEAMMAAEGFRHGPGPDAHVMILEFLAAVGGGRFEREAQYYNDARKLRNKTQYEVADLVSRATARVILRRTTQFVSDIRAWLAEHHPELLAPAPPEAAATDTDDAPNGGS